MKNKFILHFKICKSIPQRVTFKIAINHNNREKQCKELICILPILELCEHRNMSFDTLTVSKIL